MECNCCGKSKFKKYRYNRHVTNGNSNSYNSHIPENEDLFSSNFYILKCENCGYGVYERKIDSKELERYYFESYKNWNAEKLEHTKDSDKLVLDDNRSKGQYIFIEDYLTRCNKLLEIGAGLALPIRYIKYKKLNDAKLYVIESGKVFDNYYKSVGIEKASSYFPDYTLGNHQFDYIHASHWLEHVINLEEAISELHRISKPDSYFFIEVPNCNDLYFKFDIKDTPHIHFFTLNSLKELFPKFGFKIIKTGTYWLTFEEYYYREIGELKPGVEEKRLKDSTLGITHENGAWLRLLLQKNAK